MNNIEYADTSSWEKWMKEYRYGAFYIIPPNEVMTSVDKLRYQHDPKSHSISPAHISLSEPVLNPLTKEQLQELQEALASLKPFEIKYGPLRSFPPHPGVAYTINPEDIFMQLRLIVHSTSIFKNSSLKHKDISPHMTIAEFISVERTAQLLEELQSKVPGGAFLCNSIEYFVPNKDFYFEKVLVIPLGKQKK